MPKLENIFAVIDNTPSILANLIKIASLGAIAVGTFGLIKSEIRVAEFPEFEEEDPTIIDIPAATVVEHKITASQNFVTEKFAPLSNVVEKSVEDTAPAAKTSRFTNFVS